MADLGRKFNAKEAASNDIIPVGDYKAILVGDEWKNVNGKPGRYLNAKFQIVDEKCNGSIIYEIFNLENSNPDTVKWAERDFGYLCLSVGVEEPENTDQLKNIELIISVIHKYSDYNKKDVAEIKGYKKLSAGLASAVKKDDSVPF